MTIKLCFNHAEFPFMFWAQVICVQRCVMYGTLLHIYYILALQDVLLKQTKENIEYFIVKLSLMCEELSDEGG